MWMGGEPTCHLGTTSTNCRYTCTIRLHDTLVPYTWEIRALDRPVVRRFEVQLPSGPTAHILHHCILLHAVLRSGGCNAVHHILSDAWKAGGFGEQQQELVGQESPALEGGHLCLLFQRFQFSFFQFQFSGHPASFFRRKH